MLALQIGHLQLANLTALAPHLFVQKIEKVIKLLFDAGLPFTLVDGAGQTHEDQFALGLEASLLVVAVVKDDEQEIDGA